VACDVLVYPASLGELMDTYSLPINPRPSPLDQFHCFGDLSMFEGLNEAICSSKNLLTRKSTIERAIDPCWQTPVDCKTSTEAAL